MRRNGRIRLSRVALGMLVIALLVGTSVARADTPGHRVWGGGRAVLTDDGGVGTFPEGTVMVNALNACEAVGTEPANGFNIIGVFGYWTPVKHDVEYVHIEGDDAAIGMWMENAGYYAYALCHDGGTPGPEGDAEYVATTYDEAQLLTWVETMYRPERTWTFLAGNITVR